MIYAIEFRTACGCTKITKQHMERPLPWLELNMVSRLPVMWGTEDMSQATMPIHRRVFELSHKEAGVLVYIERLP